MISIVIPAYNEEDNIRYCLNAFLNQTTKEQFEIILVDNASSDKTSEIAKTFTDKLNVNVLGDPIKGRGHARSLGEEKCVKAQRPTARKRDGYPVLRRRTNRPYLDGVSRVLQQTREARVRSLVRGGGIV